MRVPRPAANRLRDVFRTPMFWVVLVAVVVHGATQIGNSVELIYSDSDTYVLNASEGQYAGAAPPGYQLFMKSLHAIWPSIEVLLAVQHLMIIVGGVGLYFAARNMRVGTGLSTVAAAIFMLNGQLLSTSQSILTETLFVALMAATVWAFTRLVRETTVRNAACLGGVLGLAATVRAVGMPLLLFLGAALFIGLILLDRATPLRTRWRQPFAIGLVMGVTAVAGAAFVAIVGGTTAGMPVVGKSNIGWALYGRVAQFADCPATYVKPSLRDLCPEQPEAERQGPDFWRVAGGPALERFGTTERGNAELTEFSNAVIRHQPLDWIKAAVVDMGRFFIPNFGRERGYSGAGPDELEIDRSIGPVGEAAHEKVVETWYRPFTQRHHNLQLVARYSEATTLTPGWWMVLLLVCLTGPFLLRGRARLGATLLLASGLLLMFLATAMLQYVSRYSLPALPFLLVSAAVSVQELGVRIARAVPKVAEPAA